MTWKLPTLAVEIVELIAFFIDANDLRSLRLVCRDLNSKTLHSFGLTNFATLQTDLSRPSLARIQSISKSEHLAIHVQCLVVKRPNFVGKWPNLVVNRPNFFCKSFGQGFDWPRLSSGCLAKNTDGGDLLRKLLSQRLVNCRSFLIYAYDDQRYDTDHFIPDDAVGLILSIVAEADLAVHSFAVQPSDKLVFARLDTPRLPMPLCQTPEFVAAWSHIAELVLENTIPKDQVDWVLHLITLSAARLRKLSLKLTDDSLLFMQRLSSLHELKGLVELRLATTRTEVDTVSSLLLQNRHTLHSLTLRLVNLEGESAWRTVFENMKSQFPRLWNLELDWLKPKTVHCSVIFSKLSRYPLIPGSDVQGDDRRRKSDSRRIDESMGDAIRLNYVSTTGAVVGVEYHGKRIDHALGILAKTMEIAEDRAIRLDPLYILRW